MDEQTTATAIAAALPQHGPWGPACPTFTHLAGAAGSGKTFLFRQWAEREKGITLTASTGIAAINLGGGTGTTINALLGYFDTKNLEDAFVEGRLTHRLGKLWRSGVRRIGIDEASMVSGDQLTFLVRAIQEVNGKGYVLEAQEEEDEPCDLGLTLIGDFCQLGPIKAPYAFESPEWEQFAPNVKILTEIHRQADPDFIAALRAARQGHGQHAADYFASRVFPLMEDHFQGSTIFAKNESVSRLNQLRMDKLEGRRVEFQSARWGKQRSEWGDPMKPSHTWGIPETLRLKIGALVMILANFKDEDQDGGESFLYVNGDLGELVDVIGSVAQVRLQRTRQVVSVAPVSRDVLVPADAARRKELRISGNASRIKEKSEVVGQIVFMPLRLAYATTVHKSQGLTLDSVQINIRDPFFRSPAMLYVALSRARTAGGLRIVGDVKTLADRCRTDPKLKGWL